MTQRSAWTHTEPVVSSTFDAATLAEIRRAAATGMYDIRGGGAKRSLPHFDDLLFLGASMSRYPLEGYRERCGTRVTLGTRYATKPISAQDPGNDCRDEFRCTFAPSERGARARCLRRGHVHDNG